MKRTLCRFTEYLIKFLKCDPPPRFRLSVIHEGVTFRGVTQMILKPGQKVLLQIQALDEDGKPEPFDGSVQFNSSSPQFVTVTPTNQDPNQAWVRPATPFAIGASTVTAAVDADLGPGDTLVVGQLDVQTQNKQVTVVNIIAAAPVADDGSNDLPAPPAPPPAPGA
jgi:hypothetical protein